MCFVKIDHLIKGMQNKIKSQMCYIGKTIFLHEKKKGDEAKSTSNSLLLKLSTQPQLGAIIY